MFCCDRRLLDQQRAGRRHHGRRPSALVGYWLIKHDFEPAPMLLGFVLGPLMEENLRRAMLIARGDPTMFFTRPISGVLLALAAILLVIALLPMIRKQRDEVFVEERLSMILDSRDRLTVGSRSTDGTATIGPCAENGQRDSCPFGLRRVTSRELPLMTFIARLAAAFTLGLRARRACGRAGLSDQDHHADRAVRGRRADRRDLAHRRRAHVAHARPAARDRKHASAPAAPPPRPAPSAPRRTATPSSPATWARTRPRSRSIRSCNTTRAPTSSRSA